MRYFQPITLRCFLTFVCAGFFCLSVIADDDKQRQFFENKIRPVLIQHCYECHAADSDEIKGGLRVDSAKALLVGGDSGAAIKPGKPDESSLIEALRYEGVEMPPDSKLPEHVIKDFEKWISDGAFDPREDNESAVHKKKTIDIQEGKKFWAFRPRVKTVPPNEGLDWSTEAIDRFVYRQLRKNDLMPNPPASKRQLIRRIYFDLIGLPPTPKQVQTFLNDRSANAFEKVVDELLASRQFGVRWGRHWLDVARYADSNGGDFNATFHNAWKYRDYVVDAFNNDKPYDLFVKEQIAGDLMEFLNPEQKADGIVATGFLMLGAKMLSERDKHKLTMDVIDEQINTVGQAFMGLTLGCARCHDHKFDPIPTRDYYALAGIFHSTRTLKGESQQYVSTWPRRKLPVHSSLEKAHQQFQVEKKVLQNDIKRQKELLSVIEKQIAQLKQGDQHLIVDDSQAQKTGYWKPSTISPEYVGKGYIHDDKSEKGEKWVEFPVDVPRSGTYQVQISYNANSGRDKKVPVSIRHAEGEKEIIVNQQKQPSIDKLFEPLGSFRFDKGKRGLVTVSTRGTELYVIVDAIKLVELDPKGKPVVKLDLVNKEKVARLQTKKSKQSQNLKAAEDKLKALEKRKPEPLPESFAVDEAKQKDDCHVRIRGEHENLGPKVPRGFLQVVSASRPSIPPASSGRLELAQWLADAKHPLTARVYVNRIWYHLLGQGIVPTVDNFGKLGGQPSHPELLDYLANQFVKQNWSTKKLIRQIVLTKTYQQNTDYSEKSFVTDPDNRWLWRAHRKRLSAEAIRDTMLRLGGKLDLSSGGDPVAGLGTLVTQNNTSQKKFKQKESNKRSMYLPMIRAEISALLVVFDIADSDLVTGKRNITNVPAQALMLLNSPFVIEQAEAIAKQVIKQTAQASDFKKQVEISYRLVLQRPPSEAELTRGSLFLESHWNRASPSHALSRFVHTMLASTEFRMLD